MYYVPTHPSTDNSTFANTDYVQDYHIQIDWDYVFWGNSTLSGSITHELKVIQDTDFVTFDIWDLTISSVVSTAPGSAKTATKNGHKVELGTTELLWNVQTKDPGSGQVLTIQLDSTAVEGSDIAIQIFYSTSPTANALTWLTPAQTAGGVYPYMFSQCEDINCRSVAPLQDTPSVKYTYGACVTLDIDVTPYMSANTTSTSQNITCFQNEIPIPSYLIAIAIGDIEYKSLGGRCAVLTEPSMMNSVVYEFSNLNQILDAVEAYVGTPYIWGVYRLLVLPPSFPFGGMENPLMNFISPTVVTGTKS